MFGLGRMVEEVRIRVRWLIAVHAGRSSRGVQEVSARGASL